MLVPLRIGLPVEIEQPARGGAWDSAPLPASSPAPASAAIRAQVTGCQCHADGLFRIHLTLQEA